MSNRVTDLEMQEAAITIANGWKDLREARQTIERYQQVLNYWFPLLGYASANELVYPALGDARATAAPNLKETPDA